MNVSIFEMPLDFGASRHGSDMGPSAIRLAGIREKIESLGHTINSYMTPISINPQEYESAGNPRAKYLEPITKACQTLAGEVYHTAESGDFPLVLGGDHSIALGSLAGMGRFAKEKHKRLGVLYVDAHGDFNTDETSPSGNIHGECLAASCGYGLKELTDLYYEGVKIEGEDSRNYRVEQLKYGKIPGKTGNAGKDKTVIVYNESIIIRNIPLEAQEYVVNRKSALDWLVERIGVSVDKDSGIVNDFNKFAEEKGEPRYCLDLILRVITVSLETLRIVRSLPHIDFALCR